MTNWYHWTNSKNIYVTKYELFYHEVLTNRNVCYSLTSNKMSFHETDLRHKMEGSTSGLINGKVNKFTAFIEERRNLSLFQVSTGFTVFQLGK